LKDEISSQLEASVEEIPQALPTLKKKAISASVWSILEYGFATGLRLVSSLVLTRLLVPAFFGEMTIVATLVTGINFLSDIGLAPSVIQSSRGDDPVFLNSAWTIQVLRGIVLWLIALAISWPMALFYHDPQLRLLLPVLALSTLISSFNSTNLLTFSRHMSVRRLFAIDGSSSVVSLVVTIIWAYFRPSVWAIVAGQLVSTVYRLCLSHTPSISPGIRNSFCWDRESIRSIVHFGRWVMLGTACFFFSSQADRLILGRLISLSVLGVYSLAFQISDVPRAIILALSQRVAYPFISKVIHRPFEEFRPKFLRYRFYLLLAGALILSVIINVGDILVLHLYDRRYREAGWMIPILALGLWQTLLYQTVDPVLYSLGKPKYNALGHVAYCAIIVASVPISFHYFGMFGAVIAIAAGDCPVYVLVQYGATRVGLRPLRQDFVLTVLFLVLISVALLLRHACGLISPFHPIP
jgi:O-antigen/teichoic acid export membrane protein